MFGKREKIDTSPDKKRTQRKGLSFLGKFITSIILFSVILGAGFLYFLSLVPVSEPRKYDNADGVVVLTGAAKRIEKAVWLVANTPAKRLLISGVNKATKSQEIKELKNISHSFIQCCIDLDYEAQNTIDNASQTRLWATKYGIKSIILVTSNYHMPRSIREMMLANPEINFIPYPVTDKKVQIKNWWRYPGTRLLLIREYFKYILSLGRMGLIKIGVKSSLLSTEPHLN